MKKLAVFVFASMAVASQAIVFPTGFFATPAIFQETFDTTFPGPYNSLPVFTVPATMTRIGATGSLMVQPFPGVISAPHMLGTSGVDAELFSLIPMVRFGGFFRSGIYGAYSSSATFRFYDIFNNPIGSATVPLTATTFQWVGFQTIPMWRRVEILGNIPGAPGFVAMDSLRIRPW